MKSKYHFIKTNDIEDIKSCINNYSESQLSFFKAFKKNNIEFYLKTINGTNYSGIGIIQGNEKELQTLMYNYLLIKKKHGPIMLNDFSNYLLENGYKQLEYQDLSFGKQQKITNDLSFKIGYVTENEVLDEEFYTTYIFNELVGSRENQINTGFNKNFVIIGSKNGIDISSYYSMTNGTLTDNEFNEFCILIDPMQENFK